jgi:hypothetical protein
MEQPNSVRTTHTSHLIDCTCRKDGDPDPIGRATYLLTDPEFSKTSPVRILSVLLQSKTLEVKFWYRNKYLHLKYILRLTVTVCILQVTQYWYRIVRISNRDNVR